MKALPIGISLLGISLVPALAQFSPSGTTTINGTVGAQTLASGTGTVAPGGMISINGSTVSLTMSGSTTLINNGTIQQTATGRAIDSSASNSHLTINNSGRITSVSTDAIRVNTANTQLFLTNSGTISVSAGGQALDFAVITGSNTITNLAGGVISAVGEDAVRPGANGIVNNAGLIQATPTVTSGTATGSDGIQANNSGVQITNSGSVVGRHGVTGGSTTFAIAINNTAGSITALNGSAINIDGVAVTSTVNVTNALGATLQGGVLANTVDGDGDGVDVDGILTLNNSGDILGYGAKGLGSDGGPNNAEGVSMGGGTIINTATGQILGSTLTADAPNGDPTRAGNGILVDNSSGGSALATANITNSGLIQGKTGFAIRAIGTFGDTIVNNASGTIRGAGTGAAIQTGGGNDALTNRGTIVSDVGNAVDLEAGDDTFTIEGGSASVTGNISGGTGTNAMTIKPGVGNAFSYSGTISNFSSVSVESGTVTFTGNNTYSGETKVTGGALRLSGAGSVGTGDVTVTSGAVFDISGISDTEFTIGAGRKLTVGGTIIATGKTLVAGGDVNPGESPGLMAVEGAFHLQDQGGLHLEVEGLDRGVTYDALDVSGLFTLEGSVIVTSSYVFSLNDTLNLIDFGSIDASGFEMNDLILPTLAGGLSWDTGSFTTDGSVSVVPEPSTGLLLCGSSALLLCLRRSRAFRSVRSVRSVRSDGSD